MSSSPSPTTIITTTTSSNDDNSETTFPNRACACFCIPCFKSKTTPSSSYWWERITPPPPSSSSSSITTPENNNNKKKKKKKEEQWWDRGYKKVREWSEIVAGPKWKTFIRRFILKRTVSTSSNQVSFHYDPLSYALNFDDGLNGDVDGEDGFRYGSFSARFVSVPASGKHEPVVLT